MNTDAKVPSKIWANQSQQHIKRVIHCDLVEFTSGFKDGLTCKSINVLYHINRMKENNHMIISVHTGKSIWQNKKSIHDKKIGQEGTYLNITKVIYDKPVNITCNHESFSFKIRKKTRPPLSPGFPSGAASRKGPACPCRRPETWARYLGGKISWRAWLSTPVFLSGESQGQRSLVGYSP